VPVVAMLAVEGLKVELVDDVQDEPGEVAVGQPVAQVGGSRKGWSRSPRRRLWAMVGNLRRLVRHGPGSEGQSAYR
jgi:hypothetical protein